MRWGKTNDAPPMPAAATAKTAGRGRPAPPLLLFFSFFVLAGLARGFFGVDCVDTDIARILSASVCGFSSPLGLPALGTNLRTSSFTVTCGFSPAILSSDSYSLSWLIGAEPSVVISNSSATAGGVEFEKERRIPVVVVVVARNIPAALRRLSAAPVTASASPRIDRDAHTGAHRRPLCCGLRMPCMFVLAVFLERMMMPAISIFFFFRLRIANLGDG